MKNKDKIIKDFKAVKFMREVRDKISEDINLLEESPGYIIYLLMGGFMIFIFVGMLNSAFNPNSKWNTEKRKEEAEKNIGIKEFENILYTPKIQTLISLYRQNKLRKIKKNDKLDLSKGVFCVKIVEENFEEILKLNKIARDDSFNITSNIDSLNYLIIVEYKYEKVGNYTGGGAGYKVESSVNVIDIEKEENYTLVTEIGNPPIQIKTRQYDKETSAYGSRLWESDILTLLKKYKQ
jgi:hypothetical protein